MPWESNSDNSADRLLWVLVIAALVFAATLGWVAFY